MVIVKSKVAKERGNTESSVRGEKKTLRSPLRLAYDEHQRLVNLREKCYEKRSC
jgi:hypothetical protein